METIQVRTPSHSSAVDITGHIFTKLRETGAGDGICLVYVPHTTAALTINEGADPDVIDDVLRTLEKIVPWGGDYRHSEGNSAAHVKSILAGGSVQVVVQAGKPVLGTWEKIFLLEFDGPRTRKVFVQFVGQPG